MVKILQAYNFAKQNTFALNGEILSATLIDSNRIAISSAEQFIEIYDIVERQHTLEDKDADPSEVHITAADTSAAAATMATTTASTDEKLPSKYTLATVGEVVNLIYCEAGKYLVTLEKENVGSPVHANTSSISCTSSSNTATVYSEDDTKMFVRIYANFWKFPEAKLIDLPITIRIASMTTPKAPLVKSIDVIELPLRSPPDLIQCCQTSGNIIVSSKERIYLYEYTQCVHESTQPRFKYIDFLPFKFFVNLNFIPLKLSLAENVIACMNNRYCAAFRVIDVLASNVCTAGDAVGGSMFYGHDYDMEGNVDVDAEDVVSNSESSLASKTSAGPSTHSHNSFETDSLETTASGRASNGYPGRTPIDFNVARMVNSACGREFEVDLKSQWEQTENDACNGKPNITCDTQEIIITPTKANEIKIKLVNEAKAMNVQRISSNGKIISAYNEDNMVQYDIRKLLQICMKTSETGGGRVVDILRCMDLKAIYQRSDNDSEEIDDPEYDMGNQQIPGAITTSKNINRRTLKSHKHQSCIGFALLVASSVDGYLYQFCAQGKWYNDNEKPIATYSFTAPVLQVHINDYVIYAITTESVETHTSRVGHKLFNNRFEYPSLAELFPEESSPDVNAPIAVVGLSSFIHVQYICVNRHHVVLISNGALAANAPNSNETAVKRRSTGEGKRNIAARFIAEAKAKHNLLRSNHSNQLSVTNEWTLYNLEVPAIEQVVLDLETIAETYRAASSSNFYDLMEEAHVMLRMSISIQFDKLSEERETLLRRKFMENCRKLADFSVRSKKKEIYMQASGFYKMCNLQLSEIYANYINNILYFDEESEKSASSPVTPGDDSSEVIEPQQLAGLIYTVKLFLISLGTSRLNASFLNQLVKPFFTPSRVVKQGFSQVPLSLEFLNLFIKYSTEDIPQIMLGSPVVADSISGEIINYLKFLENLNPEDNLLFAVTAARMSNYILSQEVVSRTNRHDLAVALIKYKNVLFDDTTTLYQKQKRNRNDEYSLGATKPQQTASCSRQTKQKSSQTTQNNPLCSNVGSQDVISFSDLTEAILLAVEKTDLIEAISDVFIHALCVEHSITLEVVMTLFLSYIASHIGQKGYQTSQKVFVNILQVYYYDLFDLSPLNTTPNVPTNNTPPHTDDYYEEGFSKPNSDRDSESMVNSIGDSNSAASSSTDERRPSGHCHRILYDQLQEQQSPFKRNSNASLPNLEEKHNDAEINSKGLKILFRMYMGRLKALSDLINDLQSADVEQQSINEDFLSLRMECIAFMTRHLQEMRVQHQHLQPNKTSWLYYGKSTNVVGQMEKIEQLDSVSFLPDYSLSGEEFDQNVKSYVRPIPCLLERPQYLNRLPPFKRGDFSYPKLEEGETEVRFTGWHNELLTLTLKIQSLLASPKIDQDIIEEFIAFVQKTPNLLGIDSFLVIVLPKHLAINYMLNFCPEYLWQYGKSNNFTPKQWESLFKKILSKKDLLPNWKTYVTDILNNLVADCNFEELLQCFPSEAIPNRNADLWAEEFNSECITAIDTNNGGLIFKEQNDNVLGRTMMKRDHLPMDNVDESNVFELVLRKAVSKQRSIALRSMIESTGKQLFDATSNPMYNL